MKKCNICKKLKNISDFYKNKSRQDGLDYRCKKCDNKFRDLKRKLEISKYRITGNVRRTRRYRENNEEIFSRFEDKLIRRLFKYGEAQHIPGISMSDIREIVLDEISSAFLQTREEDRVATIEEVEKLDVYYRHPMALFPKNHTPQSELIEMIDKNKLLSNLKKTK